MSQDSPGTCKLCGGPHSAIDCDNEKAQKFLGVIVEDKTRALERFKKAETQLQLPSKEQPETEMEEVGEIRQKGKRRSRRTRAQKGSPVSVEVPEEQEGETEGSSGYDEEDRE
jgi:hypothetical protein